MPNIAGYIGLITFRVTVRIFNSASQSCVVEIEVFYLYFLGHMIWQTQCPKVTMLFGCQSGKFEFQKDGKSENFGAKFEF